MQKNYANLDKNTRVDFILLFLTAIIIAFVLLGAFICLKFINKQISNSETVIREVTIQTAYNIHNKIAADFQFMDSVASYTGENFVSIASFDGRLINKKIKKRNDFRKWGMASLSGDEYTIVPNGKVVPSNEKILTDSCIKKVRGGSYCFDRIRESVSDTHELFDSVYAVPVYSENEIKAILFAVTKIDTLKHILTINNFSNKAFSNIIKSDGEFFIKDSDSMFKKDKTIFENSVKFIAPDKSVVEKRLKSQKLGNYWSYRKNQIWLNTFVPINYADWFVQITIPSNMVSVTNLDVLLLLFSVIIIIFYLLYIMLKRVNIIYDNTHQSMMKFAFNDDVTGGPNSNKFLLEARKVFANPANDNKKYAMVLMDIAKFKVINEIYGYDTANRILKDVSEIIKRNIRTTDLSTRYFAATFAFLIRYNEVEDISNTVDKILAEIDVYNATMMSEFKDVKRGLITKLVLLFGVYLVTDKNLSINTMCDRALLAKRTIKANVNQHIAFYDETLRTKLLNDKKIEDEMYSALERNEFVMYLQPKFDMHTLKVVGSEALVRWIHPTKGFIPPCDFIPLFEQNGFILNLDHYIWEQACKTIRKWMNWGLTPTPISVNVSRLHLNSDDFIDFLIHLIKKYNIPAQLLELELTESACFEDIDKFLDILNTLKKYGFNIAMDDFGVGYSSLNMLRKIPVDILKLDKEFISTSTADEKGKVVVKHVLAMAKNLNLKTVSEGIETKDQAEFLSIAGCDIAQGFLFARPMPIPDFEKVAFAQEMEQIDLQKKQHEDNN